MGDSREEIARLRQTELAMPWKHAFESLDSDAAELFELGQGRESSQPVDTVFFYKEFPTDVRHNAKIDREALTVWANQNRRQGVSRQPAS